MVDWNGHIRTKWSHCPLSVWGVMDSQQHGRVVIVADKAGKRLPFTIAGAPIGHAHAIENDGTPLDLLRSRLLTLLAERMRVTIEDEEIREMVEMQGSHAWGMF